MKNIICYSFSLLLIASLASCSSNSKTSADGDTTPALSTKPTEQAPVSTATPKADSLKTDTAGKAN